MGAKADAIREELEEFQRKVRETAIRVQSEQGWPDEDMNKVLRDLGLPEKQKFNVPVRVTRTETYTITVDDALSAEDAREILRRDRTRVERFVGTSAIDGVEVPEPEPAAVTPETRPIQPRDRVRVVDVGRFGGGSRVNGLTGTVLRLLDDGAVRLRVDLDQPHWAGSTISAERVELLDAPAAPASTAPLAEGEQVRIVRTGRFGGGERFDGQTGELTRVRDDGSFRVRLADQTIVAEEVERVSVTPPASGAPLGPVPAVGEPAPYAGPWYAPRRTEGGPNQCRVWDPQHQYYCTRPIHHEDSPHVAAGQNAGVLSVWEKTDSDERGTEFVRGEARTF